MRYFIFTALLIGIYCNSNAQEKLVTVHQINLPDALIEPENQFSGLQVAHNKLYLMPECRLQDKHEARLYSIKLADINRQKKDSNFVLPFEKISIFGLDSLAALMLQQGDKFEGLEAFIIRKQTAYFSVETNTPSLYCYLLKGQFKNGNIYLQPTLTAIRKPTKENGDGIFNAGFEAIMLFQKQITTFFEYNQFDKNFVYRFNRTISTNSEDSLPIQPLPFRITDITPTRRNTFTAINFFYKGEGGDTVYRLKQTDSSYRLINDGKHFVDYCRLVTIEYKNQQFYWKNLWTFPAEFTGYNWEGIAAYRKGYFIINDKYTKTRPYKSTLLYVN